MSDSALMTDHEALAADIVAFYTMLNDRYDERRDEPKWQALITFVQDRYSALKRASMSFSEARDVSMTEAVAKIIAERSA